MMGTEYVVDVVVFGKEGGGVCEIEEAGERCLSESQADDHAVPTY